MACLSQQQSVTGSQASKSTRAISHTQTAVWLKPPHQIYQQFPSWRSRLQSRNNHSGAHVSVMETQPVSPLKIETPNIIFFPISSRIVVWFECRSTRSTVVRLPGLFQPETKTVRSLCKNLQICVDKKMLALRIPRCFLFSLYFETFQSFPSWEEHKVNHQSLTASDLSDFQQLIAWRIFLWLYNT